MRIMVKNLLLPLDFGEDHEFHILLDGNAKLSFPRINVGMSVT